MRHEQGEQWQKHRDETPPIIPTVASKTDQTKSPEFLLCSTEPCWLRNRYWCSHDRLQGNNPSFSTQENNPLRSNRKHKALSVSKMQRQSHGDSGGENSNTLKYARETKKVHEGGSGLQKSNQKLNWVAQQIDIQI